jgi:hypothetical protein
VFYGPVYWTASTLLISGTLCLMTRSTPCLSVRADMGQPAHEPRRRTFTMSFSMATRSISPPSAWICGLTSARAAFTLASTVSLILFFTTLKV